MKDTVVVYYSRTGRTRWVAKKLAELLNADVEEIREAKDRGGVSGWIGAGRDAACGRGSELVSQHSTVGRRRVVLAFPVWASCPPPAVRAYLDQVDLLERKVYAVVTSMGHGDARCLDVLEELTVGELVDCLSLVKVHPDSPAQVAQLRQWVHRLERLPDSHLAE